ncbi:MAG: hypothetical protein ACFE85_13340 [Candidatus Hodarchaeota archaeon]
MEKAIEKKVMHVYEEVPEQEEARSIKIEGVKEKYANQLDLIYKVPKDLHLIKSKRKLRKALRNWKESIDYYFLHLDEFDSGFRE